VRVIIKWSILAIITFIVLIILTWYYLIQRPIIPNHTRVYYHLQRGETVTHVANTLYRRGFLLHPKILILWADIIGATRELKAGEYSFAPGASVSSILQQMVEGRVIIRKFTIVEGWNFYDVKKALENNPFIIKTLQGLTPEAVAKKLQLEYDHPEGLFYPDTYQFIRGVSDKKLLKRAYQHMKRRLDGLWQDRDKNIPFKTPYEALIAASLIEKETSLTSESGNRVIL